MSVPEWSAGTAVRVWSEPSSVPLPPRPALASDTIYTSHTFRFHAAPSGPQFIKFSHTHMHVRTHTLDSLAPLLGLLFACGRAPRVGGGDGRLILLFCLFLRKSYEEK